MTALYGGVKILTHKTDLSDNPQEFVIYFGSLGSLGTNTTDRKLQATSNPGVDQITITPTDILPAWQASTAYLLGQSVEPTSENGLRYEVSQAGTSGSTQPTWPTSGIGSTVANGTVIFKLVGASHQPSEIKLASTQSGLASAVAGASINLGTSITSGTANVKTIWVRVTNAVTVPSNNSGTPEISLSINSVQEVPN
jgi:hypothetical protein